MNATGYFYYFLLLLAATGALTLRIDVKEYDRQGLNKEKKLARLLAWGNLILGASLFTADWAFQKWFW